MSENLTPVEALIQVLQDALHDPEFRDALNLSDHQKQIARTELVAGNDELNRGKR